MSRQFILALLCSASFLSIGVDRAVAFDGAVQEPTVIYANDPQVTSQRSAYAGRSSMGGGFIQFLFGDGPQAQRYQQEQLSAAAVLLRAAADAAHRTAADIGADDAGRDGGGGASDRSEIREAGSRV